MTKDSEKGRYTSPDGSATWEYIAAMSCASLMFCSGCVAAWTAPTLAILRRPDSPIPLTSSDASTLAIMSTVGHTVATTLTVLMADKLGRKMSLMASGLPLIVSWAMIATSGNVWVLFVARIFGGVAYGLTACISPMYVGEIASAKLRGVVGMANSLMLTSGMLFVFIIAPYLSIKMTANVCLSISALTVISIWFIPDSPYFLVMVGRIEEAEGALEKLRGKTDVADELELIKITVGQKGNTEGNFESGKNKDDERVAKSPSALKQLFTVSGNRKALGINFLFIIAMQMGGFICILNYVNIIFEKMNTGVEPHVCAMIQATIPVVCIILVAFVVDKVGRKPLIFVPGMVSGLRALVISVYFYLMEYTYTDVTSYGFLGLYSVTINVIAFNSGLFPLKMIILSEILGCEMKVVASCILGVGGGAISTIGIKSYLMIVKTWGYGHSVRSFGFAVITWSSTILIPKLKMLPETKGKTLLDIQRDLNA